MKRFPHSLHVQDSDGDIYAHTFYAVDDDEAKQIADMLGAIYKGRKLQEICENCGAITEMGEEVWDEIFTD